MTFCTNYRIFHISELQYDSHFVPPWTYNAGQSKNTKSMKEAIADVTKVIQDYPRTKIITSEATTSDVGDGYYSKYICKHHDTGKG